MQSIHSVRRTLLETSTEPQRQPFVLPLASRFVLQHQQIGGTATPASHQHRQPSRSGDERLVESSRPLPRPHQFRYDSTKHKTRDNIRRGRGQPNNRTSENRSEKEKSVLDRGVAEETLEENSSPRPKHSHKRAATDRCLRHVRKNNRRTRNKRRKRHLRGRRKRNKTIKPTTSFYLFLFIILVLIRS